MLGTALKVLEPIFPRSSYKLVRLSVFRLSRHIFLRHWTDAFYAQMTKCGRYGLNQSEFDYSPGTIRNSVERSLERFRTSYLDTVYLHDVEYVCTPVGPLEAGNPETALFKKTTDYGLAEGQEGKVWGEGDQKILDAYAELRKMQEEGKIKHIGMTGENSSV